MTDDAEIVGWADDSRTVDRKREYVQDFVCEEWPAIPKEMIEKIKASLDSFECQVSHDYDPVTSDYWADVRWTKMRLEAIVGHERGFSLIIPVEPRPRGRIL